MHAIYKDESIIFIFLWLTHHSHTTKIDLSSQFEIKLVKFRKKKKEEELCTNKEKTKGAIQHKIQTNSTAVDKRKNYSTYCQKPTTLKKKFKEIKRQKLVKRKKTPNNGGEVWRAIGYCR